MALTLKAAEVANTNSVIFQNCFFKTCLLRKILTDKWYGLTSKCQNLIPYTSWRIKTMPQRYRICCAHYFWITNLWIHSHMQLSLYHCERKCSLVTILVKLFYFCFVMLWDLRDRRVIPVLVMGLQYCSVLLAFCFRLYYMNSPLNASQIKEKERLQFKHRWQTIIDCASREKNLSAMVKLIFLYILDECSNSISRWNSDTNVWNGMKRWISTPAVKNAAKIWRKRAKCCQIQ